MDLEGEGRALLFDLGRLDGLAPSEVLRVTDVFVSHTHIDHFIGFDDLVRWHLGRPSRIRIYGPAGILENVEGRLRGYTWNLVTEESLAVEAIEVGDAGGPVRSREFLCAQGFAAGPVQGRAGNRLLDEPLLAVTAAVCDHGIPSVAYRATEKDRHRVRMDAVEQAGLPAGRWLARLKESAARGDDPGAPIEVEGRGAVPLGELAARFLERVPGASLGYVTDVAWHDSNLARLGSLFQGVDLLYCESNFRTADEARAREVRHFTARDAGRLGRLVGARELRTFHFSRRYHPDFQALITEAAAAFRGEESGP